MSTDNRRQDSEQEQKIWILDGGMGRQLKANGAPFRQPEWSALALMEAPDTVALAHQQFIEAGADIITTNNYAVVPFHLGDDRFDTLAEQLTGLSGEIARNTANSATRAIRVAGSLPPLFGSYRPEFFQAQSAADHYQRIVDSLQPHIDFWLAETIGCIAEFNVIRQALASQPEDFWVSFTLSDETAEGRARLRSEEPLEEVLSAVCEENGRVVQGLLFNCSQPEIISLALNELHELLDNKDTGLLTGAYGNAFTPRGKTAKANSDDAELRDELTPEHYSEFGKKWHSTGATVLGGCCGIGPGHIAQLKAVVSNN